VSAVRCRKDKELESQNQIFGEKKGKNLIFIAKINENCAKKLIFAPSLWMN
jgi:hypothetical protein